MEYINLVRKTTLEVMARAKSVRVDREKIAEMAKKWVKQNVKVPPRVKEDILDTKNEQRIIDYLIILDTINFCFWPSFARASEGRIQKEKWHIYDKGKKYDGYYALSLRLKNFFEENPEKANLNYFLQISYENFVNIIDGKGGLQFTKERWQGTRAVSSAVLNKYGGALKFVKSTNGRFSNLIPKVAKLPTFNDVREYHGKRVYLWKRAQILGADICFAFKGKGIGHFKDKEYLTAMADYKLPQILRHWDILSYSRELDNKIKNHILIPTGSQEEVEIRAATIWAVEYLKKEMAKLGKEFYSYEIDWILWDMVQNIKMKLSLPAFSRMKNTYHLTKTIYY